MMQSEGVDVRVDVLVDSGGFSRLRFVVHIKGKCHSKFQPDLSRGLAGHSR